MVLCWQCHWLSSVWRAAAAVVVPRVADRQAQQSQSCGGSRWPAAAAGATHELQPICGVRATPLSSDQAGDQCCSAASTGRDQESCDLGTSYRYIQLTTACRLRPLAREFRDDGGAAADQRTQAEPRPRAHSRRVAAHHLHLHAAIWRGTAAATGPRAPRSSGGSGGVLVLHRRRLGFE